MANEDTNKHAIGKVIQVIGPALDIEFEDGHLPAEVHQIFARNPLGRELKLRDAGENIPPLRARIRGNAGSPRHPAGRSRGIAFYPASVNPSS